ncbi:hypothetical protein N7475_007277 [Penicillium sp. IBT 31633x]|nr:hypothetical protein N7475_007277 [Penicillium sp. IBT 31633x]
MEGIHVDLPDGHLVNLSPRPTRGSPYQAYRAEYKASPTELSATPPPRYLPEPRSAESANTSAGSGNRVHKLKATKLPVPKYLTDSRNELNQTTGPTLPTKPTTPSNSSGRLADQARSSEKGRDQYWKKIRDKFEKESPLSQRSTKSRESDNHESPKSPISYHRSGPQISKSQIQAIPRVGNVRSGIPTPSTASSSPVQGARSDASSSRPVDNLNKWRKQGEQWVNLDDTESTVQQSLRTGTTTCSSPQSRPSISPVSAEDSSMTDWEDQFVVNMPTAKDPNPPTMTAQQISEYQKSIERVHREGGHMADPYSLPSRNASLESKSSLGIQRNHSPSGVSPYDGTFDGRQVPNSLRDEYCQSSHTQSQLQCQLQPAPQPTIASQRQAANHYYSPDEIGNHRISTIWEELPTKIKEKRHFQNADGSFLGCREISGEKNPDEILTFVSPDDASLHPRPLTLTSKNKQRETKEVKKATGRQITQKVAETVVFQEEQQPNFRNTKPAQCSKQSTMCQDQTCAPNPTQIPRTASQDSVKENFHPISKSREPSASPGAAPGDDDVFIITPTITRTMIPTPDKKSSAPKPQGLRRPRGTSPTATAEAVKAIRAKAQMISTPMGLRPGGSSSNVRPTIPTLKTSQTLPLISSSTTVHDRDDEPRRDPHPMQDHTPERAAGTTSNIIRGFIHTSGLAKSPGLVRSPTDSLATILRNGTESLRHRAETLRNVSGSLQRPNRKQTESPQTTLPSRDNSESSRSAKSFQSAKEMPAVPGNPPTSPPEVKITESKPVKPNPMEEKPSSLRTGSPSKPATKKVTLSEDPPSSDKPGKLSTSTKKISALAKPSKLDKKFTKPAVPDASPPAKTKKPDSPTKKEERGKHLPRLRTTESVLEIAELDGLQVASRKGSSLQSNITDVYADLGDMHSRDKEDSEGQGISPLVLSLIFNIFVVAITQVNRVFRTGIDSPYTKFAVSNTLNMTDHCWRVFKCIYGAVSRYQATGSWPKARSDQAISRFMVDLLQAIVYLFILGFTAMLIGRTASYVVLVSSWIVWFVRPFAWALQCVGRALIM